MNIVILKSEIIKNLDRLNENELLEIHNVIKDFINKIPNAEIVQSVDDIEKDFNLIKSENHDDFIEYLNDGNQ